MGAAQPRVERHFWITISTDVGWDTQVLDAGSSWQLSIRTRLPRGCDAQDGVHEHPAIFPATYGAPSVSGDEIIMAWLGPGHGFLRLVVAVLSGWVISWLGVAGLITLCVIWPHNPLPLLLLVVWATLVAVSLAIPGASLIRSLRWPVLILAVPFVPFLRAAVGVWPHLPDAVRDFLEGSFRRHRWARQQRKLAP